MTVLAQETVNIQNPAIGAALLWRFVCGYTQDHPTHDRTPLPLLFLVLPVLFHKETHKFVKNTQKASGLRAFAAKFGDSENSKQDVLVSLHDRVAKFRKVTLSSLEIALCTRLLYVGADAKVLMLSETRAVAGMPDEAKLLMRDAEKLGVWCSALTLHEIAVALKLRF